MEQALARLGAAMLSANFKQYASTFIQIEDENGDLVQFDFNEAQDVVWDAVQQLEAKGRPLRILILKGRQQGMSTFCQCYIAWVVLTRPGARAQTVAHNLALTHDLYDKLDRAYKQLPHPEDLGGVKIRPDIAPGGDKGRRMIFADPIRSQARYDSAHDPEGVGRGGTRHVLHLTEVPQWAKPDETMQAILASASGERAAVFVETTAKGAHGWFYERWCEAMRAIERGEEPQWTPVFVPWFLTRRYARKRRAGEPELSKRERKQRDQYGITNEQMYWYRDRREELGDRVAEEYPFTWQEAFLSSGLPYFRTDVMQTYRRKTRKPLRRGSFRVYADGKRAMFQEQDEGGLRIYEMPEEGSRYVIGVDFASGRAGDNSSIVVLNAESKAIAATYRDHPLAKHLPDQVLTDALLLARRYNNAFIVPERNGIGQTLVDRLVNEWSYPHVYRDTDTVAVRYKKPQRYGFSTTVSSRRWLLEELAHLVHIEALVIPDDRLIDEMESFIFTDSDGERAEAAYGHNDDMIFALALAVRGLSAGPLPKSLTKTPVTPRSFAY